MSTIQTPETDRIFTKLTRTTDTGYTPRRVSGVGQVAPQDRGFRGVDLPLAPRGKRPARRTIRVTGRR